VWSAETARSGGSCRQDETIGCDHGRGCGRLRTSQVAVTVNAETSSQAAAAAAAVWQGTAASSVSKVAEEPWPGGSYRASDKRTGSARKARICKELLQEVAAVDAAGTWILLCPETKPI
jgi:hypothetical protein